MTDRSGTGEDLRGIEIERGKEANIVSSKMPTDKELKGQRLEASTLDGMVTAKLYGWPMPKQLKRGSREHELCNLIGCLVKHLKTPCRKYSQEKYRALLLGKSTAKEVAQRKANIKRIEESKVAAKIWEPEEDPDRKIDGLHPQIGPFALRGQLEIS